MSKEISKDAKEQKLADEPATAQLTMLLDYYDMDKDDVDEIQRRLYGQMLKAIKKGRVEVVEEGGKVRLHQHLKDAPKDVSSVIVYNPVKGQHKIAMKEDEDDYSKIYALMGAMCGEGGTVLHAFEGVDMSIVESFGAFFLAV